MSVLGGLKPFVRLAVVDDENTEPGVDRGLYMEREGLVVLGRTVEHVAIEVLQLEKPQVVVARSAGHPHEDSAHRSPLRIAELNVGYAGVTTPSAVCARYGSSAPRSSALVQRVRAGRKGRAWMVFSLV